MLVVGWSATLTLPDWAKAARYPPSEQLTTLAVALWPMECVRSPFAVQFATATSRTRLWLLLGTLVLD